MNAYTIDASVFISAFITTEAFHAVSKAWLDRLKSEETHIYCPTLVMVEVAAALARVTKDAANAENFARTLADIPNLTLVALDVEFAQKTLHLAVVSLLRGADAVYAAVAQEYAATLVTWDKEMLKRAVSVVPTLSPDKAENSSPAPQVS